MSVIIGIDPSTVGSGVAAVSAETLELLWTRRVETQHGIHNAAWKIAGCNPLEVYIEDQYISKRTRGTIHLLRRAGFWEGLLYARGLVELNWVLPRAWQAKMLGYTGSRPRPEETKRRSVQMAYDLWGAKLTHDESDAALLARYGAILARKKHKLTAKAVTCDI